MVIPRKELWLACCLIVYHEPWWLKTATIIYFADESAIFGREGSKPHQPRQPNPELQGPFFQGSSLAQLLDFRIVQLVLLHVGLSKWPGHGGVTGFQ